MKDVVPSRAVTPGQFAAFYQVGHTRHWKDVMIRVLDLDSLGFVNFFAIFRCVWSCFLDFKI